VSLLFSALSYLDLGEASLMFKSFILSAILIQFCISHTAAEPATMVFLNGVPSPVYFNDGDSFRVLAGPLAGSKARLAGYNTLESYGPVHQWGDWDAQELSNIATMSTMRARKGVWHCSTPNMAKDGYGRILWNCPDLAEELIRLGYAHTMTVTAEPALKRYVDAQQEAIKAKRGMWAHGVPDFLMTSLHSMDENSGYSSTYNRTVSTADGHSVKWKHTDNYSECQNVCIPDSTVPSCMTYVDFRRRYGTTKAACLK
jgi:endonuclease YncB( thermonuclease family)